MKKKPFILIFILSLLLFNCNNDNQIEDQGIIAYNISYPKMNKDNFMFDFMPKQMVLKFKENTFKTSIKTGVGMYKTDFIVSKKEAEFSQLAKIINEKYVLTLKNDEIAEMMKGLPSFHIEYTDETKKILNYECKKAIIKVDNEKNDVFDIFYTDKIKIKDPNWNTQFEDIKGVMLEYQYEKYGVCMRFQAQNIKFTEINDNVFDVEKEYKVVTKSFLDKKMQGIFDGFN